MYREWEDDVIRWLYCFRGRGGEVVGSEVCCSRLNATRTRNIVFKLGPHVEKKKRGRKRREMVDKM